MVPPPSDDPPDAPAGLPAGGAANLPTDGPVDDPVGVRSDVAELLGAAESHLRVGPVAELTDAITRSHLPDFRCVGWYGGPPPGWAVTIDAEYAAQEVPEPLARRFGIDSFWERWTRAECLCKLADVPMLAWWPEHGLDVPADFTGAWRTLTLPSEAGDLVVSVALAPTS